MADAELDLERFVAEAKAELWRRGNLEHLLLKGGQEYAYGRFQAWRDENQGDSGPGVLHCHRGLGKTALMCLLGLEEALQYPGALVRIGGPTLKEIRSAAEPSLMMFMRQRPADVEVDEVQDGYRVFNPWTMDPGQFSDLTLFGCREFGDSERGLRATWIGLDEVRNLEDAEYVIESVLRPMFAHRLGSKRRFMLLSGTSPDYEAHAFWKYVDRAATAGSLAEIPFTENEDFKHRSQAELESIFGPEGSVSWGREGLCKRCADENLLVLPSYTRNKDRIKVAPERPEHYHPYTFGDVGFVDAAAFLFCYIDHSRQKLVVVDEICKSSLGSDEMVRQIRDLEYSLFGQSIHFASIRRWADATPRELDDFRHSGLYFQAARKGEDKWDKWAGLAKLESAFHNNRIEIHPRCKSLHHQLSNAIKNEKHDDLLQITQRGNQDPNAPILGHFDALWALCYGVNKIHNEWLHSPLPKEERRPGAYRGSEIDEKVVAKASPERLPTTSKRPMVITNRQTTIGAVSDSGRIAGRKVLWK